MAEAKQLGSAVMHQQWVYLDEGGQAVGCAGGVGDDVIIW